MALGGFVDWRGGVVDKEAHGGVRATLVSTRLVTNVVIVPNLLNLVIYLHRTMNMGVSSSATMATNFIGVTSGSALIGAFLSDSYITRARAMLLFGLFMFLVLVVAFRNRKLELPKASCSGTGTGSVDALSQAKSLKFLDKACINLGNSNGAWSVCSATKVKETKTFVSSIVATSFTGLLEFFNSEARGA